MMVPSGMATATKAMSGALAISSRRICSRTPAWDRMPVRRMFSKAMMREEPLSASRWARVSSLRCTEMKAGRETMSTSVMPASVSRKPRGMWEMFSGPKSSPR